MSLIEQLFPRARAELLRLLFVDAERSLHLRDLARLSGLAVGTIQREVANLRDAGLILERRDGNRLYFSANVHHPIYSELRGITLKTTGLTVQFQDALKELTGIEFAFVYGSFAKGSPSSESDIDLFVIGSIGLRALAPRLKLVADTMNREINPTVISLESYRDKLKGEDAYITIVTSGSKLWIVGSDDEFRAMA
ncbi:MULTISPECIES: nucleotidyltransferase domain-containing protein [unclassified Lentimonas]|uniref:nucleotidyltransferase domain-containing protein n=1 Tax=unclassified Lentimonas TaxID=2630993 RepID=UPI0013222D2F|nr:MULTISPECIES: nucleotidyltransferase domain-containing protein [unclassified Lentimonas]CAA6691198.1 Unannotated [Lentimonas sp. CC19]CAA6694762.1 Unannotated [Lentimonas sp. CC10]CAA7071577.1 Unannotated [Lentimonas sp. CC11]